MHTCCHRKEEIDGLVMAIITADEEESKNSVKNGHTESEAKPVTEEEEQVAEKEDSDVEDDISDEDDDDLDLEVRTVFTLDRISSKPLRGFRFLNVSCAQL